MSTMNISLPEELKAFVDQQVAARAYGSASEYVRELLRRERDIEHLRGLLLEGLESGPAQPLEPDYFEKLRARARGRVWQTSSAR
jgi:antitoxin ParD1/3/4